MSETAIVLDKNSEIISDFRPEVRPNTDFASMTDDDLLAYWKDAAPVLKGAYDTACVFLREVRTRFQAAKKKGDTFWGYRNFDQLCDEKLDWTSRQVRNLTRDVVSKHDSSAHRKPKNDDEWTDEKFLAWESNYDFDKRLRKQARTFLDREKLSADDTIDILTGPTFSGTYNRQQAEAAVRIVRDELNPEPLTESVDLSKIYDESFLSADETAALWMFAQTLPRDRELNALYGGKSFVRRLRMPCYSVSPYHRGDSIQKTESEWIRSLETAPSEIKSLEQKLSELAGIHINYHAFVGYENEKDHIAWHRHAEDGCRDARVYIVSLGEVRTFGLRKMCESCRLCDDCYETCNKNEAVHCKDARCQAAKKNRKVCKVCNDRSKWILLHPKAGSLITLSSEMNRTHEHAVLDDNGPKGLRISINTKCIPESDIHFENKQVVAAKDETGPRVWDCHAGKQYPADAVYVGCRVMSRNDGSVIRAGTIYGNDRNPMIGHKAPVASTAAEFRTYAEQKMRDPKFREQAIRELHGKHLLCWCKPDNPDCHARVWLEIVNRPESDPIDAEFVDEPTTLAPVVSDLQSNPADRPRSELSSSVQPDEPNSPWDYIDSFLDGDAATELYQTMVDRPEWQPHRTDGSTAKAIHYGLSYTSEGSARNNEIPEIPPFLKNIADRISAKVGMPVNYIQCHKYGTDCKVIPHPDPKGMIVPMLVVGQERTFRVGGCIYGKNGKPFPPMASQKSMKDGTHKPEEEILLRHGSLLTFDGGRTFHSMLPAAQDEKFNPNGCEWRVSILFRWTTDAMREFGTNGAVEHGSLKQYEQTKKEYRERIGWNAAEIHEDQQPRHHTEPVEPEKSIDFTQQPQERTPEEPVVSHVITQRADGLFYDENGCQWTQVVTVNPPSDAGPEDSTVPTYTDPSAEFALENIE